MAASAAEVETRGGDYTIDRILSGTSPWLATSTKENTPRASNPFQAIDKWRGLQPQCHGICCQSRLLHVLREILLEVDLNQNLRKIVSHRCELNMLRNCRVATHHTHTHTCTYTCRCMHACTHNTHADMDAHARSHSTYTSPRTTCLHA